MPFGTMSYTPAAPPPANQFMAQQQAGSPLPTASSYSPRPPLPSGGGAPPPSAGQYLPRQQQTGQAQASPSAQPAVGVPPGAIPSQSQAIAAQPGSPSTAGQMAQVPTPARRDSRLRSLYFNDQWMLPSAHHQHKTKAKNTPADVAGGNKALEHALQVILNVQAVDKTVLAKAMLSPKDGIGGLDAMSLMQRLQEVGARLMNGEQKLRESIQSLNMQQTVNILQDLGLDDQGIKETLSGHTNLGTIHEDIFDVLKETLPVDSLTDAISAMAEKRLQKHLERRGVTRYSNHIVSLRHDDETWASVWQRIWLEYPSRPLPGHLSLGYEHRSQIRVIIIGPGFGLLATPHMIDLVRGAGYQLLELPELPNLEGMNDPQQVQAAVQSLRVQIASFQPHVICAASKGGLYLQHLWRDPNWTTSCVLINAHPNITQLPKSAAVVVTQGSRDDTFKRITERNTILLDTTRLRDGVAASTRYSVLRSAGDSPGLVVQQSIQVPQIVAGGQIQMHVVPAGAVLKPDVTIFGPNMYDSSQLGFSRLSTMEDLANLKVPASISYRHGREDLEDLARTGDPTKTLLYMSTSGISVRPGKQPSFTRLGDGHAAPESLCNDDCLPRLIDAAASGKPEDSLHESWILRQPEERRAGETFLGHDPESFKRFWTGPENSAGLGCRVPVPLDSDEFFAIQQIFRSSPADKAYNFGHDWEGKKIHRIDRVQAQGQLEALDSYFMSVQKSFEAQGSLFVNGVHIRWLFHGSSAIDSIISDPLNGFKVTLSKTAMWGAGSYFARDAQYPDDHGFFGEPRADGTKDMLLCLVVTGMSVLGDEAFAIQPYRHGTQHRYNSFVDSLANPEIFVVNRSCAVLPAYVITYG